jgi:hypothetical protein
MPLITMESLSIIAFVRKVFLRSSSNHLSQEYLLGKFTSQLIVNH